MTDLERRYTPGRGWSTVPLGGAAIQTETVIAMTDADDAYQALHDFDLGHATLPTFTITLVELNPDGEPVGTAPGEIAVGIGTVHHSFDGELFVSGAGAILPIGADGLLFDPGDELAGFAGPVARYVRIGAQIIDTDFNPYAGANHPSARVRIDIEYL